VRAPTWNFGSRPKIVERPQRIVDLSAEEYSSSIRFHHAASTDEASLTWFTLMLGSDAARRHAPRPVDRTRAAPADTADLYQSVPNVTGRTLDGAEDAVQVLAGWARA
jgi:hypothetical protein